MALLKLKYLKLKSAPSCNKNLLHENGPLCKEVSGSAIREANMEVMMAVTKLTAGKRTPYLKVDTEKKVMIAMYAAENGIRAFC